jgi:hypothetical protein
MKDILKTTIVAGTAIAMLTLSSVSASAGICKQHSHTGYGQNTLAYAKAQAKANWIAQVTAHDGAAYAQTTPSSFSCSYYDASLKLYSCTVVAKPCGPKFDLGKVGKLPFFVIKP